MAYVLNSKLLQVHGQKHTQCVHFQGTHFVDGTIVLSSWLICRKQISFRQAQDLLPMEMCWTRSNSSIHSQNQECLQLVQLNQCLGLSCKIKDRQSQLKMTKKEICNNNVQTQNKGWSVFCLLPERILPTMIITGYILILQDERD